MCKSTYLHGMVVYMDFIFSQRIIKHKNCKIKPVIKLKHYIHCSLIGNYFTINYTNTVVNFSWKDYIPYQPAPSLQLRQLSQNPLRNTPMIV